MITCSVCGTSNDDLALKCSSCKSFLQTKIDALDLFQTLWQLIESPSAAFKRIVLARHKNYVFLLGSLFGVSIVFAVLWYKNLGSHFSNVLTLVATGLIIGPPAGLLCTLVFSAFLTQIAKALHRKVSVRNIFAVVAYSTGPILFSLVLVFPLEVAVFGLDFFGENPSPIVIKPVEYVILLGFDVLAVAWSLILFVVGATVATGASRLQTIVFMSSVCLAFGAIAAALQFI